MSRILSNFIEFETEILSGLMKPIEVFFVVYEEGSQEDDHSFCGETNSGNLEKFIWSSVLDASPIVNRFSKPNLYLSDHLRVHFYKYHDLKS